MKISFVKELMALMGLINFHFEYQWKNCDLSPVDRWVGPIAIDHFFAVGMTNTALN